MSDIIIVARTRMNHGDICVGAIDMETGRFLRPMTSNGRNFKQSAQWNVGDIWRVDYSPKYMLKPPHLEDVRVHQMTHIDRLPDIGPWLRANESRVPIHTGTAEHLYEGALTFDPYNLFNPRLNPHTARLERGGHLPSMSLQLWKTDRLLVRHETVEKGERKVRFNGFCPPESTVSFRMKHVGFGDVPIIIAPGSIVSLSLARWWQRPDLRKDQDACYLQLCDILAEAPSEQGTPFEE